MKSVTITIPEELDAAAADEARRRGISKSALIRLGLAAVLQTTPAPTDAPWTNLAGFGEPDISVKPGEIDTVLYDQ